VKILCLQLERSRESGEISTLDFWNLLLSIMKNIWFCSSMCYLWWWCVVCALWGLQNAGAVIGKGGSNIKRLRQDVSCYCHMFVCCILWSLPYLTI